MSHQLDQARPLETGGKASRSHIIVKQWASELALFAELFQHLDEGQEEGGQAV